MLHFLVLLFATITTVSSERSCEDIKTSEIKMKLARDSLNQVKAFIPKCRDADEGSAVCDKRSSALAHVKLAIEMLEGINIDGKGEDKKCPKCPDPIVEGGSGPVDCLDILKMGHNASGIYTIYPKNFEKGSKGLKVFCDMDTEGGGWTVLQRRGNYSTQQNFFQKWDAYKKGFGNLERDFWLGNENIFTLSNQAVYSLRIDVKSATGEYKFGHHDIFFITDEASEYSLFIKDFTGNATNDLFSQHLKKFSTIDRPNEGLYGQELCAEIMHGAWWYPPTNSCGHMNLNGLYMPGIDNRNSNWHWQWSGFRGLLFSEMKIRRRNFKVVKQ